MTEHLAQSGLRIADPVADPALPQPNPWRGLSPTDAFFENDEIASLMTRGLFYARAGIPLHFRGAAGQGKTALALAIAHRLGRPVTVMTGHDWMTAQDMIGREVGQSTATVVDRYVHSVRRTEK